MLGDEVKLYLPFLDNAIGYDCSACHATCCRTGNIGALRAEQAFLLERWPLLAAFQRVEQPNYAMFRKTQPHCWFLRDDGWCRIEIEHGKEHKPHMCRAHPIYLARLVDSGCVISSIAPYCRWITGDLSQATGTLGWEESRSLLREGLKHGLFASPIIPAGDDETRELVRLVIAAEERIRDEVQTRPGLDDYIVWQVAFTERFLADWNPSATVDDQAMQKAERLVAGLRQEMARLLPLADGPAPRAVPFGLPLFISVLRLRMLESFFSRAEMWPADGQAPAAVARVYGVIPRLLVALVELVRTYAAIGFGETARVSYNTVTGFLMDFSPRILGLAHSDRPLSTLIGDLLVPDTSQMEAELDQLLDLCNENEGWSLGQLIEAVGNDLSVGRRLMLLDEVAVSIDTTIIGQGG